MSLCREWSLVKHTLEARHVKPLVCRSWGCEYCQPMRRQRLMAQAAGGLPNRFLTLTVNPEIGTDPADRLRLLARAWRVTVQRLRRRYGNDRINYFAVVEETKQGEPHLHILLRAPYIPQAYISDCMKEIIDSPIVDIRAVRGTRQVVTYVAKYIAKAPAQFGTAKRYWCSRTWEIGGEDYKPSANGEKPRWHIDRRHWQEILTEWIHDGYAPRKDNGDVIIAIPQWGYRELPPW